MSGKIIRTLISKTGLSESVVRRIVDTAPSRYKTYFISKRSGGLRKIEQPARELKIIQRALVTEFLSELPIHSAATAYRVGMSIKDNASVHAGRGAILKFDFKDFFPSLRLEDWKRYCEERKVFDDEEDVEVSGSILFRRSRGSIVNRLAIGAPSSPLVSNLLMHDFDAAIEERVSRDHVKYTRYADDMTFSAPRTGHLNHVEKDLRSVLRSVGTRRLKLNDDKTVLATRKYRRQVTGLILTNDGAVSIGREKKREIRAMLHREAVGKLGIGERQALSGLLAYVNAVEPDFLNRMVERYGVDVIERLKREVAQTA